jgi:hypothetical protein
MYLQKIIGSANRKTCMVRKSRKIYGSQIAKIHGPQIASTQIATFVEGPQI